MADLAILSAKHVIHIYPHDYDHHLGGDHVRIVEVVDVYRHGARHLRSPPHRQPQAAVEVGAIEALVHRRAGDYR